MNGDILDLDFMARRENWNDGISIYMRQLIVGNGSFVAKPIELETIDRNAIARPLMTININAAQKLMDELWQCGLRPTEGSGSAGAMAATQKHLEDMRSLVFKTNKK